MPTNMETITDSLKMLGINAEFILASVMNDKSIRNVSDMPQVGNSMSVLNLAIKPHSAVASR
jgi:hypothetical protein